MKAKNISFEIAGVVYEEEWYSKIRSLCLLELYIVLRRRSLTSISLFINNFKSQLCCKASPRNSLSNKMSSVQPVHTDQPYILAVYSQITWNMPLLLHFDFILWMSTSLFLSPTRWCVPPSRQTETKEYLSLNCSCSTQGLTQSGFRKKKNWKKEC